MSQHLYKKASWINSTNVYEVNLRQYTREGSFKAFARELDRLKLMGVETLWFMPVTPISHKNRKGSLGSYYACSDYTAINPEFGDLNGFKALVNQAHVMGFKVIIDWVANHTGWDHVWTVNHPDYYKHDTGTGTFKIASGMDDIIELDFHNAAMRKAMIQAMAFWVHECHIDGFRCDLAFWVTLDFWKEARTELDKIKPLFWLAEADVIESKDYLEVFDASYAWSWMHKTADYYSGKESFDVLKNLLRQQDSICGSNKMALWFTSNHDENSWNGTEYEKYGAMLQVLNVFNFTWSGIPMIYSGQELPNRKRLEFFEKDPIQWDGKYGLQDFYQTLLALRKNNPALRAADASVITFLIDAENDRRHLSYLRKKDDHEVLVFLNFSDEKMSVSLSGISVSGNYKNAFNGQRIPFDANNPVDLQPWEYLVFER